METVSSTVSAGTASISASSSSFSSSSASDNRPSTLATVPSSSSLSSSSPPSSLSSITESTRIEQYSPTLLDLIWESIITPGAGPGLIASTNASLLILFCTLIYLTVSGLYSIHLLILMVLCIGLLLSFNWFISMTNSNPPSSEHKNEHDAYDSKDNDHIKEGQKQHTEEGSSSSSLGSIDPIPHEPRMMGEKYSSSTSPSTPTNNSSITYESESNLSGPGDESKKDK